MDARPMSALPPGFVLDRDRPKSELRSLFATMQSQRGGGELRQLLQGRAQAPGPVGPALPPGFVLDTLHATLMRFSPSTLRFRLRQPLALPSPLRAA